MKKFCRYILLITGVIFLLAITGCGGEETKKKTPAKPKPTEAVSKTEKVLAVVNYIDLENRNLSFAWPNSCIIIPKSSKSLPNTICFKSGEKDAPNLYSLNLIFLFLEMFG